MIGNVFCPMGIFWDMKGNVIASMDINIDAFCSENCGIQSTWVRWSSVFTPFFFNRALSCRPVSSFPKNIPGHLLSGGHLTIVPLDEISLGQSVHGHLQPGPRYRWGGSFNHQRLGGTRGVAPLDEKWRIFVVLGVVISYIWLYDYIYISLLTYIISYYIILYYIVL